jgi:hypothetical protein
MQARTTEVLVKVKQPDFYIKIRDLKKVKYCFYFFDIKTTKKLSKFEKHKKIHFETIRIFLY